MLKQVSVFSLSTFLTLLCVASSVKPVSSQEVTLTESEITTYDGLPWGADNWPYRTKVNIVKKKGDDKPIGSAVLDRHGINEPIELPGFLATAFSSPYPVRAVFVSTWSARQDGNHMELLVQFSPPLNISGINLSPLLIPVKVQVRLGSNIVTLTPESLDGFRSSRISVPYKFYSPTEKKYLDSIWYMSRNSFSITPDQKRKFITDAPLGKTDLLVTFLSGKQFVVPIGEGTTKLWPQVFAFDPKKSIQGRGSVGSQQVFRPRLGNELPSPPEFQEAENITRSLQKTRSGSEVKLTEGERQRRLAFQQSWTKRNDKVAKFLGAWKRDKEAVYVFPSLKRSYACVVTERQPGEMKFNIGYTYAGNELIYSNKSKRTDSLYWRNQPNYLLMREFGPNQLRPVFAANVNPVLPSEMQKQFEDAQCSTAFTPPPNAQLPHSRTSLMALMLSWFGGLKLS